MEHTKAKALAEKWIGLLSPACERIEIAGSIRRGKPEVKDIELIAVPKIQTVPDLFGYGNQINLLEKRIAELFEERHYLAAVKNGHRYKQLALKESIHLDLFIVQPPAEWGVLMVIRTGPADFSQWCVTQQWKGGALPDHLRVEGGAVWDGSTKIETPEEIDFFQILGLDCIEPSERRARWMARPGI